MAASPLALIAALAFAVTVSAADQSKKAAPATPSATHSVSNAPAIAEIPKSEFIIPTTPAEGRDPFFPKSTRLFHTTVVTTQVATKQPSVQVDLVLKGISGGAGRRLAIINTRTFEVGEEHDLPTASGRVRIRCLEIAGDSVTVQVGGEQRVLRLRPGI
jgi:hypothetical protein